MPRATTQCPLPSPELVVAARDYAADQFSYDHLATGLGKVSAWFSLRRTSAALDAALRSATAAPLVRWFGSQHPSVGALVTNDDIYRSKIAEAITSAANAPAHRPTLALCERPGNQPRASETGATNDGYSALKEALGLGPDVAVAGVDHFPGHAPGASYASLRDAVLHAEEIGHLWAKAGKVPYGSPQAEQAADSLRAIRRTFANYGEHREAQRQWRTMKAKHRRPLRVLSHTTLRTNRDPDSNGPRYA